MGSTIILAKAPQTDMLRANRGLRLLGGLVSPGRLGRPLMYSRFPGLDRIDQFYYTSANVDRRTISRFYGYTLEDTGRSALRQLDPYLEFGHFVSADRTVDYSARLGEVTVPTLMIAGESDIMSDVPSTELTFDAPRQPRQDPDAVRQGRGPRRRLRPLRPRLEPLRPQRDLPPADRLARPPPARRGASPASAADHRDATACRCRTPMSVSVSM